LLSTWNVSAGIIDSLICRGKVNDVGGGGGTHVYHWSENRALTNRERARLQTFPDNFIFHGSKESVRRQIGMAVPVEGVKYILKAILKTFANVDY
jgi:DNA (cytosine-5)-methyltransferase 1